MNLKLNYLHPPKIIASLNGGLVCCQCKIGAFYRKKWRKPDCFSVLAYTLVLQENCACIKLKPLYVNSDLQNKVQNNALNYCQKTSQRCATTSYKFFKWPKISSKCNWINRVVVVYKKSFKLLAKLLKAVNFI